MLSPVSTSKMLAGTVCLFALAALAASTPAMPVYDTIIVGMGAAGCTAASVLCRAGKNVLALEAQNRVGGRVNTVPFGNGVVELGAEWIHGERPSRVYDLAIANNVSILPQDISFQAFRSDGSVADADLINELINYGLEMVDNPPPNPEPLGKFLTRKITEYIQEKHPALLNDTDFVSQFMEFMDLIIDNYESSNNWNEVTTHSKFEDLEGNLHLSWHKNGYKTFFEILLNTYNNGPGFPTLDLKFEKVVTKITYPQDPHDDVTVSCKDGTVYRARNVIVTVSLGVLKERHTTLFSPQLPTAKVESINVISIGVVGKTLLNFDPIFWDPKMAFHAFLWKEEDRKKVPYEDRWTLQIDGACVTMGSNTTLSLWTNGEATRLVETLPDEVVKRKCMELIRRFMGKNTTIPEPTDMLRTNWYSNPYTRGSYTFDNLQTPLHPHARATLAEPLVDSSGAPRVLFAGEATDNTHFSTVHGASDSGHREASRLLPKGKL
ncbi:spermine oxidase-like isoform X2 [Anticarsia gemmatalis]|uniref:spermine oxidase-like isoform X2 n=1 Tax=Anticarsia gemmatalis TaxID=129554 RepID=UPI003F75C772